MVVSHETSLGLATCTLDEDLEIQTPTNQYLCPIHLVQIFMHGGIYYYLGVPYLSDAPEARLVNVLPNF